MAVIKTRNQIFPQPEQFLVRDSINRDILNQMVSHPKAGAVLLFEGTVRNHTHDSNQEVIALDYEAQASMAQKMIYSICQDVLQLSGIHAVAVQHRLGRVELGIATIVIAVSASHRHEAYLASRTLIDRIKHECPIWKREIFRDGSSQWSQGCTACSATEYHQPKQTKSPHNLV